MNILIIGAGPAGEAAAKTLRRLSTERNTPVNITVIEKEEAGGLCLNKGCVPSKTLLEYVHQRTSVGLPINWQDAQTFKNRVVTGIRSQLETSFRNSKIELIHGTANFSRESTITVQTATGTQAILFDKAIIATGTKAFSPPPLDQFQEHLLDSDKILETTRTPKSLIVVGGGAVGCEFACLMNAAGAKASIVELKDTLLPGEDPAVVSALAGSFEERGIVIKTGNKVVAVEKTADGWKLALSQGDMLEAEEVLICIGRQANFSSLGIEAAGIKMEKGLLVLNDKLQTTNPNVFAVGDAATTRLAHAAAAQGEVAAANILGGHEKFDDRFVPRCLYSWPEVASVGAWKYQLEEQNKPVKATRAFFRGSSKALAAGDTDGFVQIVSDPESNKILGAQIIGPHATELIHIFSVALKSKMTVKDLSEVMFAHPTLGEIVRDAARK